MNPKRSGVIAVVLVLVAAVSVAVPASGQERTIRLKVAAEQANLRERPDISSAVVQQIPEGTILEADKKEGEWYLVRYTLEDGGVIAGYIHESLVTVIAGEAVAPVKPVQPVQPPRGAETRPPTEARPGTAGSPYPGTYPRSTFSLDVSLGGGGVDASDLNTGAQGLADYYVALTGLAASGRTDRLRVAYQASLEAYYHVTPWLAVGLGVDFIRGANGSTVSYPDPFFVGGGWALTVRPAVKAVPVKLCVRFYPGSGFYFRGALGYYSATASYKYRFENGTWQEWNGSADGHALGAEGGIGGEWGIARHLAIFAEASFRLARIESLSGTGTYADSEGASTSVTGSLWYLKTLDANLQSDPRVMIFESRPSEAGISDVRLATFSLSGTGIRAGIRFRF